MSFEFRRIHEAARVFGVLALGLFALAVAVPGASAQTVKAFQMVGVTTENFDGGDGIARISRACQVDFPASRMCASSEILSTVVQPDGDYEAWVRPSYAPMAGGISGEVLDEAGPSDVSNGRMACDGWSRSASEIDGLTVDEDGSFRTKPCNNNRPAACCALIPVPEPPTSMLRGGAAASLAAARLFVGRL